MSYRDKVVIITGGSRGIGAGCARAFASAGATVVVCAEEDRGGAELEQSLRAAGAADAIFVACDVRSAEQLARLVGTAADRFGRIDCLVNNAGWHPPHRPIDGFTADDLRDLLELNVVSVFTACKLALPHLRRARGNIVNVSSLVGAVGQLEATTYAATKGAVTAFTKALAIDEARYGVRANSVSPGNIDTPLWREAAAAAGDPERCLEEGRAAQLLGRLGTADEVGRLCLFIAAEATFTTGVDHVISGGAELGYGRKAREAAPDA
jgi:NAD(P)-dependent dehydrogenase (short-subunit alcohol dehydrogenase family)